LLFGDNRARLKPFKHHREIVLHDGLSRLTQMTIKQIDQEPAPRVLKWKENVVVSRPLPGFGLMFEADAVARSLRGDLLAHALLKRWLTHDNLRRW
jgi:hypothetical protein